MPVFGAMPRMLWETTWTDTPGFLGDLCSGAAVLTSCSTGRRSTSSRACLEPVAGVLTGVVELWTGRRECCAVGIWTRCSWSRGPSSINRVDEAQHGAAGGHSGDSRGAAYYRAKALHLRPGSAMTFLPQWSRTGKTTSCRCGCCPSDGDSGVVTPAGSMGYRRDRWCAPGCYTMGLLTYCSIYAMRRHPKKSLTAVSTACWMALLWVYLEHASHEDDHAALSIHESGRAGHRPRCRSRLLIDLGEVVAVVLTHETPIMDSDYDWSSVLAPSCPSTDRGCRRRRGRLRDRRSSGRARRSPSSPSPCASVASTPSSTSPSR